MKWRHWTLAYWIVCTLIGLALPEKLTPEVVLTVFLTAFIFGCFLAMLAVLLQKGFTIFRRLG
jgi:hypothetical protein